MEKEIKLSISYRQYTNDRTDIEEKIIESVSDFMKNMHDYNAIEIIIKRKE